MQTVTIRPQSWPLQGAHWLQYGKPNAPQSDNMNRFIFMGVNITTQFQRIRKFEPNAGTVSFGIQNTVTNPGDSIYNERPTKNNGFNHTQTTTILNEDMVEFDEWQVAGSCGTSNNSEVGYYVDSSFWDIELISN
jgi:hypothetical protein